MSEVHEEKALEIELDEVAPATQNDDDCATSTSLEEFPSQPSLAPSTPTTKPKTTDSQGDYVVKHSTAFSKLFCRR